jgi:hypothetical protein
MDDKTVDKAEAIARLVDLHADGKITDEELETLRAEAAKPAKKKLKALPFAAVGVLVVAALVLAVIFRGGGSSTEDSLTEAEPAVTTEEPAATTGEPAAGAETTTTPTTELPIPTTTLPSWWNGFMTMVDRLDAWCYSDCKRVDDEALDYYSERVADVEDLKDVANSFAMAVSPGILGDDQNHGMRFQCDFLWRRESNNEYLQVFNRSGWNDSAYMWASYLICDS